MLAFCLGTLILLICFSLGRRALSALPATTTGLGWYSSALGLGFLSLAVLLLGCIGLLKANYLWFLIFTLTLHAACRAKGDWAWLKKAVKQSHPFNFEKTDFIFIFFAGIAVFCAALSITAPETANDSLCYHLHVPKLFLQYQRIGIIPFEINTVHPLLMEVLYTLGLGLEGAGLAKFFHFAMGILSAGLVYSVSKFYSCKSAGLWAALLWITSPVVINQIGITYIDVALATFGLFALFSAIEWARTKSLIWILLTGFFSGCCLSTKYLGVIIVAPTFFFLLTIVIRGSVSQKEALKILGWFSLLCFITAGYWYVRNFLVFHNPVYPYFYNLFKSGDPGIHHHYDGVGVEKTLFQFLALPWNITLKPGLFSGYSDQWGAGYFAFFPTLFFTFGAIPYSGFLISFCFFYIFCWFVLGQILRFTIPVLPILAILIAPGFHTFLAASGWKKITVKIIVGTLLFVNALLAVYHYRHLIPLTLGKESKQDYLMRIERSYGIAQWINFYLPSNSKILNADEARVFYFNRPIVREVHYAFDTKYDQMSQSEEEVLQKFLREGFTHILFAHRNSGENLNQLPRFNLYKMLVQKNLKLLEHLNKIHEKSFIDFDGSKTLYVLYEISKF